MSVARYRILTVCLLWSQGLVACATPGGSPKIAFVPQKSVPPKGAFALRNRNYALNTQEAIEVPPMETLVLGQNLDFTATSFGSLPSVQQNAAGVSGQWTLFPKDSPITCAASISQAEALRWLHESHQAFLTAEEWQSKEVKFSQVDHTNTHPMFFADILLGKNDEETRVFMEIGLRNDGVSAFCWQPHGKNSQAFHQAFVSFFQTFQKKTLSETDFHKLQSESLQYMFFSGNATLQGLNISWHRLIRSLEKEEFYWQESTYTLPFSAPLDSSVSQGTFLSNGPDPAQATETLKMLYCQAAPEENQLILGTWPPFRLACPQ